MLFRKQIKSVPDVRTKLGKVIRVDNGLLDVMTVGGSAAIRGIRCSGSLPNVNDWVMISFYKNNEIVATPVSTSVNDSGGSITTIISTSPEVIQSESAFIPGIGLETDGNGNTNVLYVAGRLQITGNSLNVSTTLLPTPTDRGHFLVSTASSGSQWSKRIFMPDDDTVWIQNASLQPVIILDGTDNSYFALPMSLGASGGIWQGTGTFASPTTGLKIWNDAGLGRIAGYNAGVIQWSADTDGRLYAGDGGVTMDETGVTLTYAGAKPGSVLKWESGVELLGKISMVNSGNDYLTIKAYSRGLPPYGSVRISGYYVHIRNDNDSGPGTLDLLDARFNGSTSGTTLLKANANASGTSTLPTGTGTLAITSDIATAVNAAVSGTPGKIAKFTGTNTVGDSIITESGATISVAGTVTVVGSSNTNQLIVKGHSTQTAAQIQIQSSAGAEWLSIRGLANGSVIIGQGAAPNLTSADSIAIGYQAMAGVTSTNSIAIGTSALAAMNTSGHSNVAIGYWALKQLTSGLYNVAIGEGALYSITTGINCFGLGTNTGWNVTGSGNIGIGSFAMYYTTTGTDSIYIGTSAGVRVNGTGVTMIGDSIGQGAGSTFSISYSTYIGWRSGYNGSALGNYNTAIGAESLNKNVSNAVAIGYQAGNVQTGGGFTAVGYQAGKLSTSGTNSTLLGSGAGASLTTNGGAVMIGYQAGGNETGANRLYIHNTNSATPLIYGLFSGTGAGLRISSQATDGTPLVVRGIGSQSSSLQDWQDSSANVLASIDAVGKFISAIPTASTASINLPSGTAPSSPVSGDIWQDSTRKAVYAYVAGMSQAYVSCIFTGTADATVGNTLTDTSIMPTGIGTLTLPANFWTVGKTIRIRLAGKMSKGTTSVTRKYTILIGAVTLKTHTTAAGTTALTDDPWMAETIITCRTTGVSGTLYQQTKWSQFSVADPNMGGTGTVTVDTTASALLDYKFQWSANDASNSMVTTNVTVEVIQ